MNHKQKLWFFITASIVLALLFVALLIIFLLINTDQRLLILLVVGLFLILMLILTILYFSIVNFTKSRELVKRSFDNFVDEIMTNNSIGIIIYDVNRTIIWSSNFITSKFHKSFIGIQINDFLTKLDPNYNQFKEINTTKITIQNNDNYYEIQFWPLNNSIIIRDITLETLFKKEMHEQKSVIGELEIDNYSLLQSVLSEEQLFNVNKVIIDTLNECVERYNLIYRQYTNGKFILITNKISLKKLKQENFAIFTKINERIKNTESIKLSVSLGLATGWSLLNKKLEQAKKALNQAQSRGGDQIAIFSDTTQPIYFGSYTEILSDNNRTKIRVLAEKIAKKMSNPDIENVIIYGHKLADLDAVGSAFGIYNIAKAFNKEAYIAISTFDATTTNLLQNIKKQNVFIKIATANKLTSERSLIFIVDTSHPERTDNIDAIANSVRDNVFVLDHHRPGKSIDFCTKTNMYVDTNASSASEIVTELSIFLSYKVDISKEIAQLLLNGIYLDTTQFSKSTSKRAFEASAWLETKGADSSISVDLLKYDDTTAKTIKKLLTNIIEVREGYYLAYSDEEASSDVISIAANEILKVRGRKASFVVAKLPNSKTYKLSARGIDTNVQVICEAVGGGGHFATAAAESQEELPIFADNIRHAITTAERT
ncbi:c-di-AMP phosphodiesterase-like protein [Mycoplasmopsis mustelae]|uniref:C-di-AMP phosphodiesterase-like protein n=1 Tax=Mycoplasmopsis mustelae TaxID=171289 RepID=A0A4R7UEE4_9BACT|nr:DHH family phosphoesterase [Mycoplasmopsis mustelae]TDV24446.1 c-di-AMP phosphodiesterase-like protein [Mycoplasmopsis mustelae]